MLLSTIQGTQVFVHYIEGSTAQLVKHKALNLVDVDSSPMVEITSYDVIINKLYIKVPAQYYLTEPALGGYQLLLSTIQGTQVLIHYIEGSTPQLVKHKALNLVDVGSSPMMGVASYDVIFNEVYIKSQFSIILLIRPLEATRCC